MPRKGQKKRWFWQCTFVSRPGRDCRSGKRCSAVSRGEGYCTREEAAVAAMSHKHSSTTWMPDIWSEFI